MTIKRKLSELFVSEDALAKGRFNFYEDEVEITLTPEELERASSIVDSESQETDAKRQILDFAGYDEDDDDDSEENIAAKSEFSEKYGIDLLKLANGSTREGMKVRNEIIERFEHDMSRGSAEDVVWELAISHVLERVGAEKRIKRLGWTKKEVNAKRKRYHTIRKKLDDRTYHNEEERENLAAEKDEIAQILGPKLWE